MKSAKLRIHTYISRAYRAIFPFVANRKIPEASHAGYYITQRDVNGFYRVGLYNLGQQTSRTTELVLSNESRESIVYLFLEQRSAERNAQ